MNTPAHILIIDDIPVNLEVLGTTLGNDYDIQFATSGPQGLALVRQQAPDLILLDVMMPGMDGYEVLDILKSQPATRSIPVVFVTAKSDSESETRAIDAGAVDFIHKPINPAVVRARVRLQLELQRSLNELKQVQQRLQVLSMAIEQSPTSVVITGPDGNIEYVNPQFNKVTGYTAAEAIGQNPRILNSGLTPPETFVSMWEQLVRGEPWSGELVNRRKSGEVYWEEAHLAPIKDAQGETRHYVAVKLDITERKQALDQLKFLAHHDTLTGLLNRGLFFERVALSLALARRKQSKLALMFLDLDKFKPVNDQHGHAAGDAVLKQSAQRMTACVRESDTVGRIGGDEFVLLLQDVDSADDACRVAEKIRQALNQPFEVDGQALSISATIGLALYPDHGADAVELSRHADVAMYQAKALGRNQVLLYRPEMGAGQERP